MSLVLSTLRIVAAPWNMQRRQVQKRTLTRGTFHGGFLKPGYGCECSRPPAEHTRNVLALQTETLTEQVQGRGQDLRRFGFELMRFVLEPASGAQLLVQPQVR
jgi:hypothetical protein